ncbi:acyl-CoA dehydrogenase family protein [Actinomadura luteofluorescens]|uniref:acyl-CoA dehydrogenase family protein n=1 Tax=Actinomadura luteofluorescens TaxID=46163 RepID=UPI00362C4999
MDPWQTPERAALRALVRDFTAREIAPFLAGWEDAGELPRSLHVRAAEAGLLGAGFPEEAAGPAGSCSTR